MAAPGLTPAVAVVDSRNIWGATRSRFGSGRPVLVEGVREALRAYGFEVVDVYVGIATTTTKPNPSGRLASSLASNERYATAVEGSPHGHVLRGRLVERNGELEEKLVDVLCAMQIARSAHDIVSLRSAARAIVVLSEDMDLIPAYEFAQELGVPVFAAAQATVDTRDDASWMLLGEGTLRTACARPSGRLIGQELRQELTKWLTATHPHQMNFKVRAWESRSNSLRLVHNSGAIGIWHDPPRAATRTVGAVHRLHVAGVEPCQSERDFPLVTLTDASPTWPPAGLVTATVEEWRSPTRVSVKLASGSTRGMTATPGTLLPGDPVLVHEDRIGKQVAWRLIGRVTSETPSPGWADSTVPELVRVTQSATSSGARVRAEMVSSGVAVTVQPPGAESPKIGDLYAVVPIRHIPIRDGGIHVMTIAVSSKLPPSE